MFYCAPWPLSYGILHRMEYSSWSEIRKLGSFRIVGNGRIFGWSVSVEYFAPFGSSWRFCQSEDSKPSGVLFIYLFLFFFFFGGKDWCFLLVEASRINLWLGHAGFLTFWLICNLILLYMDPPWCLVHDILIFLLKKQKRDWTLTKIPVE